MKLFFNSVSLRRELEPHCRHLLNQFRLPSGRLLCFFDDNDPDYLRREFGESYCGFHTPVIGSGTLPPYVTAQFYDDSTGEFASGEYHLSIFGRIPYSDVRGGDHEFHFCRLITGPIPGADPMKPLKYQTYNYSY